MTKKTNAETPAVAVVKVENNLKRRTTKVHTDGDIRPPRLFREHWKDLLLPGQKVAFELLKADKESITLKISKAAE